MNNPVGTSHRYFYVVFNLAMLTCTVAFLSIAVADERLRFMLVPGLGALALLVFGTVKIYLRTGIWRFIHSDSANMDERELALARTAVQKAYAVFTVTVLVFVMLLSMALSVDSAAKIVAEKSSSLWIIFAGLIYYAHSLPGVFIVLGEKYLDFN